jgi:hypothetical protein
MGNVSGGDVEEISRRLDRVETDVSDLKPQAAAILAVIPHLATKADVVGVKADLAEVKVALMKWYVGTGLTCATLAFTAAKLVH